MYNCSYKDVGVLDLYYNHRVVTAMPMKSPLEYDNIEVEIIKSPNEVTINLYDTNDTKKDRHGNLIPMGTLSAAKRQSYIGENYPRVYEINHAKAPQGWGPILYDLALEYATKNGDGLTSDKLGGTTDDARSVWDYYSENRSSEVDKEYINHNDHKYNKDSLDYIYKKEDPYWLSSLSESGQLKIKNNNKLEDILLDFNPADNDLFDDSDYEEDEFFRMENSLQDIDKYNEEWN